MRNRVLILAVIAALPAVGLWLFLDRGAPGLERTRSASPHIAGTDTASPAPEARTPQPAATVGQVSGLRQGNAPGPSRRATGGLGGARMPAPLSAESLARLRARETDLGKANPAFQDYRALQAMEGRDPNWSPMIEGHFATHLQAGGEGFDGLEVSAPHCSRTVCSLGAAVKPGVNPSAPKADFQTLLSKAYGDAWFRENFVDLRVTMGGDANGTLYVAVFERK